MKKIFKKMGRAGFQALARLESVFDAAFLVDNVPLSAGMGTGDLRQYMVPVEGRRLRILEIGSREVTGPSQAREQFADADYVGFDYYPGRNVDVVGDVHRLSSYFPEGETFDIIYSTACFEHFAMPWLVAIEIAKMLNVGGILLVATHFSFGAHERPWNFFQFSDMGLRVLFSSALGFECIASSMSNPMVGRFSRLASKELQYQPVRGLYGGSEYLGRKVKSVPDFDWSSVPIDDVVFGTTYPPPKL